MSAIIGIFHRNGLNTDEQKIKNMNDLLYHRGADGSAIWYEGPVALGHQMLYTTPESIHENLPFEEDGLVITADARIDNRSDLSEKLGLEDNEEVSDSYFILKSYQKWGENCLKELLGDFAFVVWDKDDENLFCARDHMGVKPFYYYLSNDIFLFSTEIKAIFSVLDIPKSVNKFFVSNVLTSIFTERKGTFYQDIFRLPAAHFLWVDFNNHSLNGYWELDANRKIYLDSDREYTKLFISIFNEAVRCRLRSAFPVGSTLSGGLDSSYVTCTAQNMLKKHNINLKTFSAYFDSVPLSNERYFIEKVLSCDDFDSHHIKADEISPLAEIERFLWFADQPNFPPNTFMSWNIYREANKNGVRVLLDGLEGDVTVSHGDGYLSELARKRKLKKFFHEVQCTSKRLGISPYKIIYSIGLGIITPHIIKRKLRYWRDSRGSIDSKFRIINKNLSESMELEEKWHKIYENGLKIVEAHQRHYYSLRSGYFQYELEEVEAISSPFSIELRHPFFDKRLIEFSLAIPTEQKFSEGWDRVIMRRAMSKIILEEITWRKNKGDLSYNFNKRLIEEQPFLEDNLFKNSHLLEEYVDIKRLQEVFDTYISGDTPQDSIHIWTALNLSLWLKEINKN